MLTCLPVHLSWPAWDVSSLLLHLSSLCRSLYCPGSNSLLADVCQFGKFQRAQDNGFRIVFRKAHHVTPLLRSLHCLPVLAPIDFKMTMLCYIELFMTSPQSVCLDWSSETVWTNGKLTWELKLWKNVSAVLEDKQWCGLGLSSLLSNLTIFSPQKCLRISKCQACSRSLVWWPLARSLEPLDRYLSVWA